MSFQMNIWQICSPFMYAPSLLSCFHWFSKVFNFILLKFVYSFYKFLSYQSHSQKVLAYVHILKCFPLTVLTFQVSH